MKIDANKSDVQVIGDITEFKTGIDPKNLEFITTLLSSNLYSAPEQSFMREIVSNAWDSHVEAGNTDTPVIIKLNSINNTVTIRDYGTGLSPERFKEVYCNIGSSTKRDTNDYIGGFGIGKYSSLACTNIVNITSYYNHMEYNYLMVKSGNSITTNLLNTTPTKEDNGVQVTINIVEGSMSKYLKALQYLVFFPNIYVDNSKCSYCEDYEANNIVTYFNKIKIKRFKHFSFSSKSMTNKILLGNVLYPCDLSKLDSEAESYLRYIKYSGIVININIGEINITPNRESIIYTSETIDILNKRIKEAHEEIISIIKSVITKDYDDIFEYSNMIHDDISFDFIENKIFNNKDSYSSNLALGNSLLLDNISLKGAKYSLNSVILDLPPYLRWCNIKYVIYNNRVCLANNYYPNHMIRVSNNSKVLSLPKGYRCSQICKSYLRENYEGYIILDGISEQSIKDYLILTYPNYKDDKDFSTFVEEASKSMIDKVSFLNPNTDKDFLEYKKVYQEDTKMLKSKSNEYLYLYEWRAFDNTTWGNKYTDVYKGINSIIDYIKGIKGLVIVDYIDTSNEFYAHACMNINARFITAKKSVVKDILEANLTNVKSVNYIFNSKKAIETYTLLKYLNAENACDYLGILNTIPYKHKDEISMVLNKYNHIKILNDYIKMVNSAKLQEDSYIAKICKKYLEYYKKYNDTVDTITKDGFSSVNRKLVNAVIIKNKVYRVNYDTYKSIKHSKIINILCRK